MGFGGFFGGVGLCILGVLLAFLGFAVLFGFVKIGMASADVPLGIGAMIVALVMVLGGWYSFESSKPDGTVNVHNQ
jgi:high-affinity Fe2+/Pb2+ permease